MARKESWQPRLLRSRLFHIEMLKLCCCLLKNDTHIKPQKTVHVLPYAAECQTALPTSTSIQYY